MIAFETVIPARGGCGRPRHPSNPSKALLVIENASFRKTLSALLGLLGLLGPNALSQAAGDSVYTRSAGID